MSQRQRHRRIIVPRVVDAANLNAQALNAKAMLSRFAEPDATWLTTHYDEPPPALISNPRVALTRLWQGRLWPYHFVLHYQSNADAIFYANKEWTDDWALRLRKFTGRKVPLILTLEGPVGDEERERRLSAFVGHPVYCIRASPEIIAATDHVYRAADHIIAISPFLERIGRELYGNRVSTQGLGVEGCFFEGPTAKRGGVPTVVGAGSVISRKRIDRFIDLAAHFPGAQFIWYGDGPDRGQLQAYASERKADNFRFAGMRAHQGIAAALSQADIFLHTARAEGVPKVIQEAVATGLPIVLLGYYEAPSVVHDVNGLVAWSDEELADHLDRLISDAELRRRMGEAGRTMAKGWAWDIVARNWEREILSVLDCIEANSAR